MVVAVFGESCVGKSTFAGALRMRMGAQVYSGKDYLRRAKNEDEARRMFAEMLRCAEGAVVYVLSEPDQLPLLPEKCVRVLMTADLEIIQARFARRMNGVLPPAVAAMLAKKHGMFDQTPHDLHLADGTYDLEKTCADVTQMLNQISAD